MNNVEWLFNLDDLRSDHLKKNDVTSFELSYVNSSEFTLAEHNSPEFWSEAFEAKKQDPMAKDRLSIVSKLVKKINGKWLNVGVGEGKLERLVNRKNSTFGIDITLKGLSKQTDFRFNTAVARAQSIPFKSHTFDAICALEVIEHIPFWENTRVIGEFYRVLKTRGTLVVSVPLSEEYTNLNNPNQHLRRYHKNIIRRELERLGFSIMESHELYAFDKMYTFKSKIMKFSPIKFRNSNNIILICEKK